MFRPLAVLALLVLPATLSAQSALPLNTTTTGALGAGGEAVQYRFEAASPGVLTVAVHGDEDFTLAVQDEDGQPLPDGTADRDLGGHLGAEMLAVVLSEAGVYRVVVRSRGGGANAAFTIGATFVAMPPFARPPIRTAGPRGRPRWRSAPPTPINCTPTRGISGTGLPSTLRNGVRWSS